MNEQFLGFCANCGAAVYDQYILEFDDVFCNHRILERKEDVGIEDHREEQPEGVGAADYAVPTHGGG